MDGTIRRLKEKRDKELAKSILETKAGMYDARQIRLAESKVKVNESFSPDMDSDALMNVDEYLESNGYDDYGDLEGDRADEAEMCSESAYTACDMLGERPRGTYAVSQYDARMCGIDVQEVKGYKKIRTEIVEAGRFKAEVHLLESPEGIPVVLSDEGSVYMIYFSKYAFNEGKKVNESDSWKSDSKGPYITHYREDYLTDAGEGPYIAEEDGEFTAFMSEDDTRGKDFDNLEDAKEYIESQLGESEKVDEVTADFTNRHGERQSVKLTKKGQEFKNYISKKSEYIQDYANADNRTRRLMADGIKDMWGVKEDEYHSIMSSILQSGDNKVNENASDQSFTSVFRVFKKEDYYGYDASPITVGPYIHHFEGGDIIVSKGYEDESSISVAVVTEEKEFDKDVKSLPDAMSLALQVANGVKASNVEEVCKKLGFKETML